MTRQLKAMYAIRSVLRRLEKGQPIEPDSKEEDALRLAHDILSGVESMDAKYTEESLE